MLIRNRAVWWCLAVLLSVVAQLSEGRWHDLRSLRLQKEAEKLKALLMSAEEESPSSSEEEQERYNSRHRRHRPPASSDDNEETSDESFENSDAEYDELLELQRTARQRLLDHRRHRSHPHHHQHHRKPLSSVDLNDFVESEDPSKLVVASDNVKDLLLRNHARGKRHNRRRGWTERDKLSFGQRPRPEQYDGSERSAFELEVREAQNSSLCNYTVVPIPDPGGRIPRDLEHVRCNHAGSKCQDKGTYCCIQTYRHVEVMYESGKKETMKVYSGCVCSLQIYGTLEPYLPELGIND